jgi:hypothetical protein
VKLHQSDQSYRSRYLRKGGGRCQFQVVAAPGPVAKWSHMSDQNATFTNLEHFYLRGMHLNQFECAAFL